jgi:hypothetical protein
VSGNTQRSDPTLDDLIVRSIAKWALAVSLAFVMIDAAILWNYPFPGNSTTVRGTFYGIATALLILATAAITFLGYRVAMYLLFLPLVTLCSSIFWLLIVSAAI